VGVLKRRAPSKLFVCNKLRYHEALTAIRIVLTHILGKTEKLSKTHRHLFNVIESARCSSVGSFPASLVFSSA
jgi:hypothetical protein